MDVRRIITIGLFILMPWVISAQSMYSSIGLGDLALPASNRAAGLGVQGVAVPDFQEISVINPAFWHQLEFTGITTRIQSTKLTNSAGGLNYRSAFDGFNFHFPMGDVVGIAFGFAPLSHVSYDFARSGHKQFPDVSGAVDTVEYNVDLSGSGGVGGNFFGLGWQVNKRLSLGLAYNLLIGQIESRRTLDFVDGNYAPRVIASSKNIYGGNMIFGAAYSNVIRKSDNIGVRVEIPVSMTIRSEESLNNNVTNSDQVSEEIEDVRWPLQMSVGYQTQLSGRWLAVSEVSLWSPSEGADKFLDNNDFSMSNGLKIGAGIEYASAYDADQWWQQLAWRAGFSWRQYMETDTQGNQPTRAYVVTGMGVPFGDAANRLDFSVHYGQRNGFTANDPVETDIGFSIGITVSELWFNGGVRNR